MELPINTINHEVIDFMRQRRSVPAKFMSTPAPNDEELGVILEIAARVPDHGKLAPWRFIRYSATKCAKLGEQLYQRAIAIARQKGQTLSRDLQEIEKQRFLRAPVIIAVVSTAADHPKIPQWEQVLSAGAVAMNMLVAANAHGFDAQWLSEWYAYDEELAQDLGLKDNERFVGFIHIGTRTNPKFERDRPNVDQLLSLME